MTQKMKWYDWISFLLVTIGAINWGIYGFSRFLFNRNFDLITSLLHSNFFSNLIFILVGVSGVYSLFTFFKLLRSNR